LKFIFKASNNEVEYEALIARVELCYTAGADSIQAFSDSQLVVNHSMRTTKRRTIPWRPRFVKYARPPGY